MALMMHKPIIRCVTDTSVSMGELGVPDEIPDMPIKVNVALHMHCQT